MPSAVSYCAVQDATEKGYEVVSGIYQAQDLHLKAAGKSLLSEVLPSDYLLSAELRNDPATAKRIEEFYADPQTHNITKTTFRHGFNIVTINNTSFLIDLSFSQFVGADGMLVQGGNLASSGISVDHPLAQQLLQDGFVPLTDENLRTYMRFLTTEDPDYLRAVTVDLLDSVPPLRFTVDDNELAGEIPPAYRLS